MNNSKKLLALLIALAMLVTFAAPTFADGETDPEAPPVEEVETPEEIVEEEFDITFKLSDEIKNISSADFTVVAKGDETKTPITKAKAGTELEILLKDDIYYYYYSLILNGEGIRYDYNNGYYSFKMPNEKAVIEVTTGNGYGSNFISARENFKPEGWVSVTINTDEHSRFRVYSERNRYGSTSNQELFYVNPYHEVDLISGYRTYLGPVQLEIDDLHYLTEDSKVVGIFKEATTKNLKCEKMNNYKVILHKYNEAETVEKEYSPKALYTDVVKFLRANETGEVEGKKFVGWMTKSPYANYSKNPYDEIYALDKKYDKYHFIPKYYFNNESTNNVYKDIELFEVYTTDNVVYSGPKSKIEVDGSEIDTISIYYVDFVEGDEELYLDQNKKYYEFDTSTGKFADHEFAHDTEINKDYFLGYQTERREEKDRREPDRPVFTLVGEPRFDYTDEEEPLLDLTPMVIDIFTLDSEGHIIGGEYVQYKDFASKGITLNYKDGQKLTAEDSDKPIKITYRNNGKEYFLYTGEKLIVPNDGFDKNNITEIKVKDQPQLTYDHDDDDKLQKFDLDSLVVTLTSKSTKAGETDQDVIRDVKFADFEKYGLKLSLKEAEDKDPVEIKKDSDVKLAYDKKKLTVSWKKDDNSDPIAEETDEITVNDKVFRLENTVLINKKIDPDTSYIVGDELDLSKLVLTFTDNNKNTKDFTYEELKAMGFKFELCGEDFKTDEEKLAEAKKTAEEEANQLNNLNEAEKAEFKKAIEAAADEETVKKVKAEAKLKDDFIGAANAKFSRIKDKEGVYTSEYNPTNRTVNVTILDKTEGARQISGTGLVANLFDLYKNNKLVKLQIGENRDSQSGEIQVVDLNALAELAKSTKPADQDEDNAIMNQFAVVIGSQLLSSVQKEGNNTGKLADFIDQSVDIKAMVLDGDIETEVIFKVNGIDGTPTPEEPAPAPGKDTEEPTPTEPGDDTEESAPTEPGNDTEEPQPEEPAEPGTGGGSEEETVAPAGQCKPIDQMNALELKDNAKKITITGPAKIKVADEEVDAPDAIKKYKDEIAITVEDKNKVEFAFESATANKTLPTEVTSLLAENKAVDKDTKVELDNPKITTVEVADGKWTFKGWFVDGKEVTEVTASERITKVVGKWEFEEKAKPTPQPQPGGDDNTGDRPYNPPYYPGYYYDEPYVPHTRDYSKKDDYKPAERREEKKEENKDTKGDILRVLYFYLDKGFYEMEVNGEIQQIPMDVQPMAINQRTMLPIRFVAEAIGATVEWHQDTQSATFTKDGITATITLGSNIIQVSDGRQIVLDAEPAVVDQRIFVPLTNISQIFGLTNGDLRDGNDNDIEWDQENYRVIITVRENQ